MPSDARLPGAPALQALHEPTAALPLRPRPVLQRAASLGRAERLRGWAGLGGGALLVHVALGAAFFFLLSFRDAEVPREVEIPVEVVSEPPRPAPAGTKGGAKAGEQAGVEAEGGQAGAPPGPAVARPDAAGTPQAAPAPSVAATQPTPPPQPAAAKPSPPPGAKPSQAVAEAMPGGAAAAAPAAAPAAATPASRPAPQPAPKPVPAAPRPPAPALVAPPPEAGRAATQAAENRPANLVPDEHQSDQATREARPAAVPGILTTSDAKAKTSVPAPAQTPPAPVDRPTPPTVAKVPSQADKLAAVLPMDASAMPSSFRSVLAGNAAAQINAAYGSVVQGRIRQATAELSAAASARRLTGSVAVRFTVEADGKLSDVSVVQSSGDAALDAMVLRAIERIAPLPPPPPEAEHTFAKAFLIGG